MTSNERLPQVREIKIEGEFDLATAHQLSRALDDAAGSRVVLIDLSECEFIDSSGTAVIVHAHVAMRTEGRRLALFNPSPQLRRHLELVGLVRPLFVDAEAALVAEVSASEER